jgi:hypothetical protein
VSSTDEDLMQLSVKKGIGFICIPKCGSTTVERFMRPSSDFSLSGNPQLKHIRYEQVEGHIWPLLAQLHLSIPFTFAVVREPVSWVESWYRFRARDELAPPEHPQHHNFSGHITFPEYVEAVLQPRPPSFARIHSQHYYVRNKAGEVGVDKIIPLEQIGVAVPALLEKHGIRVAKPDDRRNVSEVRNAAALPDHLRARLLAHLEKDVAMHRASRLPF